ncbi:MAG: SET domain-containing protein [Chlamydiae bacterium]|nr:SET domain-containing protein [Chlamydiota bacterium]
MNELLKKFHLIFSSGPKEIIKHLQAYSKKLRSIDCPKASKDLLKRIDKYQSDLKTYGIPPFLELKEVNEYMQTGVFLKPDAKGIKKGSFIGIYTGEYEIVLETETKGNHYAYDVAPGISIQKGLLKFVRSKGKNLSTKEKYSIQTNAVNKGNFTRYINHSSVDTNIEAMTRKLPDGTIEVCLFTTKKILPGEQLLSSYGGQYWSVLPIIPEPIYAKSYTLSSDGKIIKNEIPIEGRANFNDPKLIDLRNALELGIDELPNGLKRTTSYKKIKEVPPSLDKKIEQFEDEILERGMPLNLELISCSSILHFDLILSKKAKKIKKGSFVGVYGGRWNLSEKPLSHDIQSGIKYKDKHLVLRQDKSFNFSKMISSSEHGNLKTSLYKRSDRNELILVISALRDILPGERLSVKCKDIRDQ